MKYFFNYLTNKDLKYFVWELAVAISEEKFWKNISKRINLSMELNSVFSKICKIGHSSYMAGNTSFSDLNTKWSNLYKTHINLLLGVLSPKLSGIDFNFLKLSSCIFRENKNKKGLVNFFYDSSFKIKKILR